MASNCKHFPKADDHCLVCEEEAKPKSRFAWREGPTAERLRDFIALTTLTAQVPLIDVQGTRDSVPCVRVWTAYDLSRTYGTFTEIAATGLVRTVTVYPSGYREEIIVRPADKANEKKASKDKDKGGAERVRGKARSPTANRKARGPKRVPKRAQVSRSKK